MRILLVGAGAAISTKDVENGYLDALRADSSVEVFHYALDARLSLARDWLFKLWRARGRKPEERPSWPDTIYRGSIEALEMALRFDVDWVIVISAMYFHPDVLEMMHRARLRTAVLFTESPYEDEAQARVAALTDVVWTTERTSVQRLGARYLRHAYDPARHQPSEPEQDIPAHDVVFVGTGFAERIELLEQVSWDGIDLGLYGEWSLLGSRHRLRKYVRGHFVDNTSTAALYRRAKIGLNLHRLSATFGRDIPRIIGAESMNPRAYELAACEVFQLSDYRAEVAETFDHAVPTFASAAELEDLVRHYLNHSPERRRLARLARQRIMPHTFAARAAQVLSDLDSVDDRLMLRGA
jgi:spore maturation protein CgeB